MSERVERNSGRDVMKSAVGVLVALAVAGSAPAAAMALDYDGVGRVVTGENYAGPGLGVEDAALAGVAVYPVMIMSTAAETSLLAVAPASFIVWGALRTDKYRPAEAKEHIAQELALKKAQAPAGSVSELLQ